MTIALSDQQGASIEARIIKKQLLSPDILRLVLSYDTEFNFFASQFINLQRADGLTRSYSIANSPQHIEA